MKLKRSTDFLNENEETPKFMFKVRIETMGNPLGDQGSEHVQIDSEIIDQGEADTKEGANKIKRELMKKHELTNYAGHVVNFKKRLELFTNY